MESGEEEQEIKIEIVGTESLSSFEYDAPAPIDPLQTDEKLPEILNGYFFRIVNNLPDNRVIAQCQKCLPKILFIKGPKRSSSNFLAHLKRAHKDDVYVEYKTYRESQRETPPEVKIENESDVASESDSLHSSSDNTFSSIGSLAGLTPILNGKFFRVVQHRPNKSVVAQCLICQKKKAYIKGPKNSSSNYLAHIKRIHGKEIFKEYRRYLKMYENQKQLAIRTLSVNYQKFTNNRRRYSNSVTPILDGKFFKIVKHRHDGYVLAQCLKCQTKEQYITGDKRSSSNFLAHLKRIHGKDTCMEYRKYMSMLIKQRRHRFQPFALKVSPVERPLSVEATSNGLTSNVDDLNAHSDYKDPGILWTILNGQSSNADHFEDTPVLNELSSNVNDSKAHSDYEDIPNEDDLNAHSDYEDTPNDDDLNAHSDYEDTPNDDDLTAHSDYEDSPKLNGLSSNKDDLNVHSDYEDTPKLNGLSSNEDDLNADSNCEDTPKLNRLSSNEDDSNADSDYEDTPKLNGLSSNEDDSNGHSDYEDTSILNGQSSNVDDSNAHFQDTPILDGKFFKVVERHGKIVIAQCLKCEFKRLCIKGPSKSSSNFIAHLKRTHGRKAYLEYAKYHQIVQRQRRLAAEQAKEEKKEEKKAFLERLLLNCTTGLFEPAKFLFEPPSDSEWKKMQFGSFDRKHTPQRDEKENGFASNGDDVRLSILDGTFFQVVKYFENGTHVLARCLKCVWKEMYIKGSKLSSTNFLAHLKRAHGKEAWMEYQKYLKKKKRQKRYSFNIKKTEHPPNSPVISETIPQPISKPIPSEEKVTPILDGKFFQVVKYFENGSVVSARCLKCVWKDMYIKGPKFSSSNFIAHLRRAHGKEVWVEYQKYMMKKQLQKRRSFNITEPIPQPNVTEQPANIDGESFESFVDSYQADSPNSPVISKTIPEPIRSEEISKNKVTPILDGTFFQIVKYIDNGPVVSAKCLKCVWKDMYIKGPKSSSSNFIAHLRRAHGKEVWVEYQKYIMRKNRRKRYSFDITETIPPINLNEQPANIDYVDSFEPRVDSYEAHPPKSPVISETIPEPICSEEISGEKVTPILDGTFFQIVKYIDNGPVVSAKCLKCVWKDMYIKGPKSSSSNFIAHLRRAHGKEVWMEYQKYIMRKNRRKRYSFDITETVPQQNVTEQPANIDYVDSFEPSVDSYEAHPPNSTVIPETIPEEISKEKVTPILDGKFFQVVKYFENGSVVSARCLKCVSKDVYIKGPKSASSNFIAHLRRAHGKEVWVEYQKYIMRKQRRKRRSLDIIETVPQQNVTEQPANIDYVDSFEPSVDSYETHSSNSPVILEKIPEPICSEEISEEKVTPILDGKFFQVVKYFESGSVVSARCLKCVSKDVYIKGPKSSSSNFIAHLRRAHGKEVWVEYQRHMMKRQRRKRRALDITETVPRQNVAEQPADIDYVDSFEQSVDSPNSPVISETIPEPIPSGISEEEVTPVLYGEFFRIVQTFSSGIVRARCLKCVTKKMYIKGPKFSSSNFVSHIKKAHSRETYEEYKSYMRANNRRRFRPKKSHDLQANAYLEFSNNFESQNLCSLTDIASILDGNFFKVVKQVNDYIVLAQCVICEPDIVFIRGPKKSSSNFIAHLKRYHGEETYEEFQEYMRLKRNCRKSLEKDISTSFQQVRLMVTSEKVELVLN